MAGVLYNGGPLFKAKDTTCIYTHAVHMMCMYCMNANQMYTHVHVYTNMQNTAGTHHKCK